MQEIVVLGGLGDVYLVASLFDSFRRQNAGRDATLVVKSGHAAVADLFGVPYRVDDRLTFGAEADREFQQAYDNSLRSGRFYAHSCMANTRVRLDRFTTIPDLTQADMMRMLLGLDPEAPMALPAVPQATTVPGTVMIVAATTWPDTQPGFYPKLVSALRAAGRNVWENDRKVPLKHLLINAACTEWVIGPQCGLMSILVAGRWPCRKTLATPDIDGGRASGYWARSTFPYAYVRKFSGFDFDVEEHKITDANHAELIGAILDGPNGRRLWPHDPRPAATVSVPLAPGDFLDRLAVLTVKRAKFGPERRAAVEREHARHAELRAAQRFAPEVDGLFGRLVAVHFETFDLLETMVPAAVADAMMPAEDHVRAVRLNKERVEIKRAIDAACRSPYTEVKSYYGG